MPERGSMPAMKLHELMREQAKQGIKKIELPKSLTSEAEKTASAQEAAAKRAGEAMIAHASKEARVKLEAERAAQDAAKAEALRKDILKRYGGIRA